MTNFDRVFLSFILTPILPIILFLTGWWVSLSIIDGNQVFIAALVGLISGIVLDVFYLTHWVEGAYHRGPFIWLLIYSFYSICFFGFFMGVPVFNLLVGVPVGILVVRQAKALKYSEKKTRMRIETASWISVLYMTSVCIASAAIALTDPYTGSNLKGMLNLSVNVTGEMIRWLILVGGTILIATQYALTKYTARFMLTKL